jgi:hypothetical protein
MDRRYQVFVSSTYQDLIPERSEVMQALLELDCIPAGMELFPSANEEQWNWIKKVIDESDYYIVIVAGRYGSVSEITGLSYTEMEYRYAIETNKPVITFLHEDISKIEAGKSESSPDFRKKLQDFRNLCKKKLCKTWSNPSDLGAKASRSITQLIKHEPAIGWIRADQLNVDRTEEVLSLTKQVEDLKKKLEKFEGLSSRASAGLSFGVDQVDISFDYEIYEMSTSKSGRKYPKRAGVFENSVELTWDEIFFCLAPELISSFGEGQAKILFSTLVRDRCIDELMKTHGNSSITNLAILKKSFDQIKVQFLALGLIMIKQETSSYYNRNLWSITPQGKEYMLKKMAIKRS